MLKDQYGFDVTNVDLAKIGQYSENNFNGCNCGIMDQFASAMGKADNAIFLDTADLSYEYAPVKLDGAKIVVTNSMVKHSLVTSAYNDRRNESSQALADLQQVCGISTLGELTEEEFEKYKNSIKDEVNRARAKHAVYENQKALNNELDNLVTSTKYSDLSSKAKTLVSNGNAYNEVINSLDKAKDGLVAKLNTAVTKASEAASLVSSYNPSAHYTDVKAEICG